MANRKYWKLGSSDLSLAASYVDSTGTNAGAIPLSSEELIWTVGSDTVTTGLTSLAAVDLAKFWIGAGAAPKIGSTGASMSVIVDASDTGELLYQASGGYLYVTSTGDLNRVIVDSAAGLLYITGGTVNELHTKRGFVHLNDSAAMNGKDAFIYGGEAVIMYKTSDTLDAVKVGSGTFTTYRPFATLEVAGGTVNVNVERVAAAGTTATLTAGRLNWMRGGVTNLYASGDAANPSTLDFSKLSAPLPGTMTLNLGPGCNVIPHPYLNGVNVKYFGGRTGYGAN